MIQTRLYFSKVPVWANLSIGFRLNIWNISPRYPCEQVLQSSGFRLNIWNWLCFSLSVHVMISATDTSNALCKLQLQKNDAFTAAPTTEWHDCLSRISEREMSKLYILTYYLYFVYREETFVSNPYWCVSEWVLTLHSTIYVTAHRCEGEPKKTLDLRSGSYAINSS